MMLFETPRRRAGEGLPCAYCRRILDPSAEGTSPTRATRDHVWPRALAHLRFRGAPARVWACAVCNHIKGDMAPEQWLAVMQATPHWWTTPSLACRLVALKEFYGGTAPGILAVAVVAAIGIWRRSPVASGQPGPVPGATFEAELAMVLAGATAARSPRKDRKLKSLPSVLESAYGSST